MANEFKHNDPGDSLSYAEFVALNAHVADGQIEGDVLYFDGDYWIRKPARDTGPIWMEDGDLAAGEAGDFAFAWQNPRASPIIIQRIYIYISTPGGTANAVIDIGTTVNAITHSDNLIDGLDLNQTGLADNIEDVGDNGSSKGFLLPAGDSIDWITGQILVADAMNLVGKYRIRYSEIG